MQQQTTAITLTRDELVVFLRLIGVPTMNGLEDDPLGDYDDNEAAIRLNSGEHSLLNRELVRIEGDEEIVLDDTLVALVGGAVGPEATLLLSRAVSTGETDPHYFYLSEGMLIEQFSPRIGVHSFVHIPNERALKDRMRELLAPLEEVSRQRIGLSAEIPFTTFDEFLTVFTGGDGEGDTARQTLEDAGCPSDIAAQLADDYRDSLSWYGMSASGLRGDTPVMNGVMLLILSEERCWLVQDKGNSDEIVTIATTDSDRCQQALFSLLTPLLQNS